MVFLSAVVVLLFVATALMVTRRGPVVGFALCICLYPIFLVGVFTVPGPLTLVLWLALAAINMAIQYTYLRRERVASGIPAVMFASLFLWPVQYGGLLVGEGQRKSEAEAAKRQRQAIGPLPAEISGTVAYTHHIDTDPAEDMVWLEEYPDVALWIASDLFDDLAVAEGARLSVTIDERTIAGGDTRLYILARGTSP